jgi:hypothetical protein
MAQEEIPKNEQTIQIIGEYFPNNEEEDIPELKLQNRSVAEWTKAVKPKKNSKFPGDNSGVSPPPKNSQEERCWGGKEEHPKESQITGEYGCTAVTQKRQSRMIWTKDQIEREIWKDVLRDTAQFVNSHDHRHGCQAEALMGRFQEVGIKIGRDLIEGYWNIRTPIRRFQLAWITDPMLQFIMQRIVEDMSNTGVDIKAALGHQLTKKGMAGHMNINYAEQYKAHGIHSTRDLLMNLNKLENDGNRIRTTKLKIL